jgi:putative membrane protein
MPSFLLTWLLTALALIITAYIVPGFAIQSLVAAIVAAVVLGLINAVVKPILVVLTLPLTIVTLGLFLFVINAIAIWLAGAITPGFTVAGFLPALLGSIVLTVVASGLDFLFGGAARSR